MVFYCRTISASTVSCTSRRMCCFTHCAVYCVLCQPLLRAFSGWIQSPHPTAARWTWREGHIRCRANMAHIRQSRPDYGLGFPFLKNVSSCCLFARKRLTTVEQNLLVSTQSRGDFIELMPSTINLMPATAKPKEKDLKGFEDFYLKAKAIIWP